MKYNYIQKTGYVTLPDGEKIRIKAYGKTQEEAISKFTELKLKYQAGLIINKKNLFAEYSYEWVNMYKKPSVTEGTLATIMYKINKYMIPRLGNMQMNKITTKDLQKCLMDIANQNLSKDYMKKTYNIMFNIFEQAKIDGIIQNNPAKHCVVYKCKEPFKRRALTKQEREQYIEACQKLDVSKALMFNLSYYCGLRPAEVRALKKSNFNPQNATITITNSINAKGELTKPKTTSACRTIPVPDALLTDLIYITASQDDNDFIIGDKNRPCTKQRYERTWEALARKANFKSHITPYFLRHNYCTMLAENEVPIKTAQYLMGHSSIEMTGNVYTEVTEKLLSNSAAKIRNLKI